MALDIKVIKKTDDAYSVELKGEIDTETYQQFENELNKIVNEKTKAIILDTRGVTYINSMGIGVIIRIGKILKAQNATFAMTSLQPQVKKLFDAVKVVLPMVNLFDSTQEADQYLDKISKDGA